MIIFDMIFNNEYRDFRLNSATISCHLKVKLEKYDLLYLFIFYILIVKGSVFSKNDPVTKQIK